jgi:predicted SAM-dependent methyltransferase
MKLSQIGQLLLEENLNNFLLSTKKNRKYKSVTKFKGVNLGCGYTNPTDWMGVDGSIIRYFINLLPKAVSKRLFKGSEDVGDCKIVHQNLYYGMPFPDGTVKNIYTSHFLEHMFKEGVQKLLFDCVRVLETDGVMRICVPSLEWNMEHMEESITKARKGDSEDVQLYLTKMDDKYVNPVHYHKWTYLEEEMKGMMEKAGFREVNICKQKEGRLPDIEILDYRTGIFIEGVK